MAIVNPEKIVKYFVSINIIINYFKIKKNINLITFLFPNSFF